MSRIGQEFELIGQDRRPSELSWQLRATEHLTTPPSDEQAQSDDEKTIIDAGSSRLRIDVVARLASTHEARVEVVWTDALKRFFARMTEQRAAALGRHPFVKYVGENAPWYFSSSHQTTIDPATCDPTTTAWP